VTLKNGATLRNVPGSALQMEGKAIATLNKATITRTNEAGCAFTAPSVQMRDSTSLTTDGATISMQGGQSTTGIFGPSAGNVTVKNTTISGHTAAGIRFGGNGQLTVAGSTITANNTGINANITDAIPHIGINGSKIEANHVGIEVNVPELFMGNSSLSRNGTGIAIAGTLAINQNTSTGVFLGGAGAGAPSNGNNVIRDNTGTSVNFNGTGNVFAAGNTWNANTQGADAQGQYAAGTVVSGSDANKDGTNFTLRLPNSRISL
jgi:hypothetical protein